MEEKTYIVKVIQTNYVDEEEVIGEMEITSEDNLSFSEVIERVKGGISD